MKVQVGEYLEGDSGSVEEVEFEGEEIGLWEGVADSIDPNEQFSATLCLYECPDGYMVHELLSPLSPDRPYQASLYPVVGHLGYGTYTKEEAREKWGQCFEVLNS
jgi:hypothetical protein